jgi:hypothetical protein
MSDKAHSKVVVVSGLGPYPSEGPFLVRSAPLLAAGPAEGLVAGPGFDEVHALCQRIGLLREQFFARSLQ